MGRPILSPGKKLTGGKFRPVTPAGDFANGELPYFSKSKSLGQGSSTLKIVFF